MLGRWARRGELTKAKGMLLFAVALLATAVALVVGGSASATQQPIEMKVACALKSNGLMRYVSNLNQCKSTEDKVTIKPGPVLLCIQPSGSVRKVTSFSACKPPAMQLTLPPTSGTVYFCATNSTGEPSPRAWGCATPAAAPGGLSGHSRRRPV